MRQRAPPTAPGSVSRALSPHAGADGQRIGSVSRLRGALNACRRCDLWRHATQGVPGEGGSRAALMLVGEAPGDAEDLKGHPFVGPAGALLDRALREAGIDRQQAYVTNAVKHFKFEERGKRRLHSKPNAGEIKACHWWMSEELRLVAPKVVVALGATAARTLLGRPVTISATRSQLMPFADDSRLLVTIHPSYLLRIPEEDRKREELEHFINDLKRARAALSAKPH